MAGSCWFHCRLRLSREGEDASSCWLHCRLRMSRKGEDNN